MASHIENIVNVYKTMSKIPSILAGKLNNAGNRVTSRWSIRNLDKGSSTKYTTNYILDDSFSVLAQSEFGTDVSNEILSAVSPKETYKAVIREDKSDKDKKQYLEVWSKNSLAHCIDLTALELHGSVYADSEFGNLDWSYDETAIVYVAERKEPKSEPYIKRKGDKQKDDTKDPPKKGQEFLYKEDWGEQLVGKFSSVIVVCRLQSETFTVLDHLPSGCCPGQVRYTPEGKLVGVSWETEPRRLGLIFCTNRPGFIFSMDMDGTFKKLSQEMLAVRSPRVLCDGSLVWLQRAADGPHHACHQFVIMKNSEQPSVLIDLVQTESRTNNNQPFYGVYSQTLPRRCSAEDGRIVFSTPQRNEVKAYVVDVDSGHLTDISITSTPGSTSILDVRDDVILATYSNMTTPGQLFIARLPTKGSESDIKWVRVSDPVPVPPALATSTVQYLHLKHEDTTDDVKSFSAIYFSPKSDNKLPLIVWPHGGPHSNFVNAYSLEAAMLNILGFASLQINYRGSTGSGDESVRFLPGRAGQADVVDCKLATDVAVTNFHVDNTKLLLFGGSHGGFLVTHLSGQYPDVYKAVVSRNPVIDVATMFNYTDINEWDNLQTGITKIIDKIFLDKIVYFTLGFSSVRCNYRGSIGFGDANVRSLLGHVGSYDVTDCHLALTHVLERDSTTDVVLYGGSFGGFIVGHLAGQFPTLFRAAVMRNPLIDLATKGNYADNSDGCAVEAGFKFTERGPVSDEELLVMRRCSPLAHVHKVRAPTALMLGAGDRRVPKYQGLEYARRLRANGVETRVYMYEDNHSLSSPAAEMDNLINSANWFLSHIHPTTDTTPGDKQTDTA